MMSDNYCPSLYKTLSLFSVFIRQKVPADWWRRALQGAPWGGGQGWELKHPPVQVPHPQGQEGGEEALDTWSASPFQVRIK